jgi:hypothetical protein
MTAASLLLTTATAADASVGDVAARLAVPALLVVAGVLVVLWGRTQRTELLDQARRGGFGGPPGTSDVGTAEGFGVEQAQAALQSASRKVLLGLGLMLVGALGTLAVIVWELVS